LQAWRYREHAKLGLYADNLPIDVGKQICHPFLGVALDPCPLVTDGADHRKTCQPDERKRGRKNQDYEPCLDA